MAAEFTILSPPDTPVEPQVLHHVHLFHVIRSTFGVMASDPPDAIRAALPMYETVDFSVDRSALKEGYLATLPTDKIVSVLVETDLSEANATEPSLPHASETSVTPQMQILHLASALVQITMEDTNDGRFAKIAQDAIDAAGIAVEDDPEA